MTISPSTKLQIANGANYQFLYHTQRRHDSVQQVRSFVPKNTTNFQTRRPTSHITFIILIMLLTLSDCF